VPQPQPGYVNAPAPPIPSSSTPVASGTLDIVGALEKLGDLRTKGILTDAEFAAKKAELLSRL